MRDRLHTLHALRPTDVATPAARGSAPKSALAETDLAAGAKSALKTVACVNVGPKTAALAAQTIRHIAANSLTCARIVVTTNNGASLDRDAISAAAGAIPLVFVGDAESLPALKKNLRDSGAMGVLVVSAGLAVPYAFDVRLAKIAAQDASVGSVSPFCDVSAVHWLREPPIAEQLSIQDTARLDRLAFLLGQKTYFEVPEALSECCLIPATALGRLTETDSALSWSRQLSQAGHIHVLSDSVYVGTLDSAAISPALKSIHAGSSQLAQSRNTVLDAYRAGVDFKALPGLDAKPVQLHVIHDLGGGSNKWLKDYSLADSHRVNLVLKPFTHNNSSGCGLALYTHVLDSVPLRMWRFSEEIAPTVVTHPEYRAAVRAIISEYCVDAILVSSLIGHSLDILNTGLPTAVVQHDYFPYCPAINIYFRDVCRTCDKDRLDECFRDNPKFNPFVSFLPAQRALVREQFVRRMQQPNMTVVAPSRSVEENLLRLDARFKDASFAIIPHGYGPEPIKPVGGEQPLDGRLRILLLGQLSVLKGVELLQQSLAEITQFAEVFLVGCGELGELFKYEPGVSVVSHYEIDHLPGHVAAISPHVGMLLSIVPETFSYALTELTMLGVPVAATRVGSFPERVRDGETGYLFDPNAKSLVSALKTIDGDRETLGRIRENLLHEESRTAAAMVADYHRALPVAAVLSARYPLGPALDDARSDRGNARDESWPAQALAVSNMWKEVKSAHLQLSMSSEASLRAERHRQHLENEFNAQRHQLQVRFNAEQHQLQVQLEAERHQLGVERHQFSVERHELHLHIAETEAISAQRNEALAQKDKQIQILSSQVTALTPQLRMLSDQVHTLNPQVRSLTAQVQALHAHIGAREAQLAEILASTSWKISSPVRAIGRPLRALQILLRSIAPLIRDPASLAENVKNLFSILRTGGISALKAKLLVLQAESEHQNAWRVFHEKFKTEVRPRIVQRIEEMPVRPLIGIILPTYNTPAAILKETLRSVQNQLYPNWELCIADDGSSLPHVQKLLEEFAAKDSRIKLHLAGENKGVSHASNRALEMTTADFVILLDHDDLLEEQALFRVAETVLTEDPDMWYSDEVMVSKDARTVLQYAFRPAFSPELLRGHPYFVHLAGFRTQLLRDIGGFDESLHISQDYDLFLRASEKARTVVHIPEILYQWRIHGGSSGKQKMDEVMETSKAILRRHLQRSGQKGQVNAGAGFNLFDTRYELRDDLKVAIIIPTKNHGPLVRQCIDSIRKTVSKVHYDIVVIDHESDDPETLAYFLSIAPEVQVLRYEGPFNFSAINNWAVEHLTGDYTHYLLCNNDIEATQPGWLERMLELGQQPSVGIVGPMLLYPDGVTIQHAGVCVGTYGAAEHFAKFLRLPDVRFYLGFSEIVVSNHEVSAVTAACLLIRKEAFQEVLGFDEAIAVGFGDVDLCLRVGERGYRVLFCPHARLVHHESFTRGKSALDPHPEDSALYRFKWQKVLEIGDPYSNPGVSINSTAWQMKYPIDCNFEVRRRILERDAVVGRQRWTYNQVRANASA